ncbi:MAG: phage major capsid protein [Ignavibacteria bacterium]|nr:phage major capsid protein [Ignavibacteria bacterium]
MKNIIYTANGSAYFPGNLLTNLEGKKDAASEIKEESKKLFEKFKEANEALKSELKKDLEDQQKEKLSNIHTTLNELSAKMKENTNKFDQVEKERKELEQKIEDQEKEFAQKLADMRPASIEDAEKEVKKMELEATKEFMRTGILEQTKEVYKDLNLVSPKVMIEKWGQKATLGLSGNEFIIPAEIDSMIQRLVSQESEILDLVNVVRTTTRDYRKLINQRGAGIAKAAETTSRSAQTAPTLSEVEPSYGEYYTLFGIYNHTLDDAGFDIEQELLDATSIDFAESIDTDFVSGSGTNTIKGLNAYSAVASPSFGQLLKIVSETAGGAAITYNDLMKVIYGINKRYRRNGAILTNRATVATIRQIEDTNGNLVMRPSFNEGRFEENFLGYPVKESEEVSTISGGNRALYFGDFYRGYLLHILRGMRMIRDPYTTKGTVLFYVWERVGGGLADSTALCTLQMTTAS